MKDYYVYLMTNKTNRVLYIGVTNNMERRVTEHKMKKIPGFTSIYNVTKLVYVEVCPDIDAAIRREKQIKGWLRRKKRSGRNDESRMEGFIPGLAFLSS